MPLNGGVLLYPANYIYTTCILYHYSIYYIGMTDIETKKCNDCYQVKAVTDFSKRRKDKPWLFPYCRQCMSVRSKKWAKRNPEAFKAYQREWHKKQRQKQTYDNTVS